MHIVEKYLENLREIRSTGAAVPETSYYGALESLLNEIGKDLKPKVRCVPTVMDTGAGHPDFGLYSAAQFLKTKDNVPLPGQPPERGVIEVKGTGDDSWLTAAGKQVSKYWGHYGQVLVTNYRDFVFIGQDESGNPVKLETFRLADSEIKFWALADQPRQTAKERGDRLVEYLRRVMLNAAPLDDPEQLAWFLASYAREAKARVEDQEQLPGLSALRQALEQALGLKFEGEDGEGFFRATLVQTLFYGVFSSWVLWSREHPPDAFPDDRFNWHEAAWNLHVPMIASLFEQIATPQKLKPLGLDEVLDWTGMVLNRVRRRVFFEKFEEQRAVQYFYEPFLQAYDPELRKALGVWYTPPEIVKYQVERVHAVLQQELEIEDGLADPSVYVLDPCCGTGAYLVEVINKVHQTLQQKGEDALIPQKLKQAATQRIFGFEILPAPFVVSHLQVGLLLRNLGAPLAEGKHERAGVYLTNALTGWEPPKEPKDLLPFPEMQEEKDAAERVKRDTPILVILGNPPYNAFAGTSPEEELGLVEPYKKGLNLPTSQEGGWGIKKFNLDDLYVRFFRIAERRIVKGGMGIVSYISNFSYLSDPSFVVMRKQFLSEFDRIWIDCLNGDSRETGKLTPDGKPDPSVFSTEQTKVGIRVGTAVCVMVRKEKRGKNPSVKFKHFWGINKRRELLESAKIKNFDKKYQTAKPDQTNRFSFKPSRVGPQYNKWPSVVQLCAEPPTNGLMEKRGGALIDIDREALEKRIRVYYDPKLSWQFLVENGHPLTKNAGRFNAKKAREKILSREKFDPDRLCRYSIRPFDVQWCYYSATRPLWNEPRPSYWKNYWEGNKFFMTRFRSTSSPEGAPCFIVNGLSDDHFIMPDNSCFAFLIRNGLSHHGSAQNNRLPGIEKETLLDDILVNLSAGVLEYLETIRIKPPGSNLEEAGAIWMHALAVGYSPLYLSENADGIGQDWPRVPLPSERKAFLASTESGRKVAALLDVESDVSGVTSGRVRTELKVIGVVSRAGGGPLDPGQGDLDLTAGWGHGGKDGACMPGRGLITVRSYTKDELRAIETGAKEAGLSFHQALELLGPDTRDVYLNQYAHWRNIPAKVWDYYIGGYQVIKKWLSYREKTVLGRSLHVHEVEYVTEMARRLAAIILLGPELDRNYETAKDQTYQWS